MTSTDNAKRIADAGIDRPLNWDEMGSSAKDRWEDAQVAALDKFSPAQAEPPVAIYAPGALLLGPDGTSYRAREPRVSMFAVEDGPVQDLVASDLEGRAWLVRAGELPRGVRVIWEPDAEDAVSVVPSDYVEEQGRVSIALALVDDLSQEACDLGQNGLAAILAESFHAIEKFRARPSSMK